MRGEPYEMNEPSNSEHERELRAGERVELGGRVGVLRYLHGKDAAVVRFDQEAGTKVVPLRRVVACTDELPRPILRHTPPQTGSGEGC
jgi:hypothetical protein